MISEFLDEEADVVSTLELLALDYPVNNIGTPKAIKWIAKAFDIFEEEVKGGSTGQGRSSREATGGEEAEQAEEGRRLMVVTAAVRPCSKEVEEHMATHIPFRS